MTGISVAPDVAFGFESQPGHQGQFERGSYNAGRPTAGLYTYGGTGCYAGAEAALPGKDFDGSDLTPDDFLVGGDYEIIDDNEDPAKVTLCRPGVRTMWDAMLSEGRRFWFFASSDWHNRGAFGPLDFETTNDFWPGEYQENYVWVEDGEDPARDIVDGLRSGNSYAVQGQLIDQLEFTACNFNGGCATMGETLEVSKGDLIKVKLTVRDPKGKNNSKYAFDNPSLLQIDKEIPINEPELVHIDFIRGEVTEIIEPTDPEYFNPLAPVTTYIAKSWDEYSWNYNKRTNEITVVYVLDAQTDAYIRSRGSNIPAGTPNERDIYGNPLSDKLTDNIPCADPDCPPHIGGVLTADVEAWADVWFYSNPIFIDVK